MEGLVLETARIRLRKLTQEDFEETRKLLQDPEVMYAYEGPFNDEETQQWIDKQLRRYQTDGFGLWAMIERTSGTLIGQCGLTYQDIDGERGVEVGYLLRKPYWHQGYATEAAIACKEYAFRTLGVDQIYSIIRDTNIPSRRVAERNGMRLVGSLIKHYRGADMPHLIFRADKSNR